MSPPRFEGGRVPTETHYCSRPNAAQNTAELAIKKLSDQHGCEGSTNSNLRGQQPVSPARLPMQDNTGTLLLLPASPDIPKTRSAHYLPGLAFLSPPSLSNFSWGICHAVTPPTQKSERENSLATCSNVL
jgi:hypothetical protein